MATQSKHPKVPFEERQLVTPIFRVSFPWVFTPRVPKADSPDKTLWYELDAIFPKDADLSAFKNIIKKAKDAKWGPDESEWPEGVRNPFKPGDKKKDKQTGDVTKGYKGMVYCKLKSKKKPQVVDGKRAPITETDEVYGGCYARAFIQAYAYENSGNCGVSFELVYLQKTKDGEPFGAPKHKPLEDVLGAIGDDGEEDGAVVDAEDELDGLL